MAPRDKEPPFLRRPQAVPRKRKRPGALRLVIVGAARSRRGHRPRGISRRAALRARALRRLGQLAGAHRGDPRSARPVERPQPRRAGPRAPGGAARRATLDRSRHPREAISRRSRDPRFGAACDRPLSGRRTLLVGRRRRPADRAVRSAARPDRVRDPERRFPRASRGGRPARGSARRAARVFLGALGNRLAPGRRIRYDGWDLSQAGSRSTGRRPGENSRAARGAQFH